MEISYRKEIDHNYLVLEDDTINGTEYTLRMLQANHPAGFLPLHIRRMNGRSMLFYEITSKQPLSRLFENHPVGSADMDLLFSGIETALQEAQRYLLNPEELLLLPDYIYLDPDKKMVGFCYCPGEESAQSLKVLGEYLIRKLDHSDRHAVEMGYQFFDLTARDNISLYEAVRQINANEGADTGSEPAAEQMFSDEDEYRAAGRKAASFARKRQRTRDPDMYKDASGPFGPDDLPKNKGAAFHESKSGRKRFSSSVREDKPRRRKKEKRQRRIKPAERPDAYKKKQRRRIMIWTGLCLALSVAAGAVVWLCRLDLTQAGGLSSLIIALIWLSHSLIYGRKKQKEGVWQAQLKDLMDSEDEDDFYETLANGKENWFINETADRYATAGDTEKKADSERPGADETAGISGTTRCIGSVQPSRKICLVSDEPRRCHDLVTDAGSVLIGKKKEAVDLCIPLDVISRLHARLELEGDACFLTDLNSMNGTFVNGERLEPNERRQVKDHDQIRFATLGFRLRLRDY